MAFQQLKYLMLELRKMNNTRWWRWYSCWFSTSFITVANYRISRFFYLLLGHRVFPVLHMLLSPAFFLLRPWFRGCEIHYKADLGPGLLVLHPNLGVVVTAYTIAGRNLTLTGGNCIGRQSKKTLNNSPYVIIGDNVSLGANANIIGPLNVGSNVEIGAGAVVVKNLPDNVVAIGVPALPLKNRFSNFPVQLSD